MSKPDMTMVRKWTRMDQAGSEGETTPTVEVDPSQTNWTYNLTEERNWETKKWFKSRGIAVLVQSRTSESLAMRAELTKKERQKVSWDINCSGMRNVSELFRC